MWTLFFQNISTFIATIQPGVEAGTLKEFLSWITMIAPLMPGILLAMLKKFK
jgi:hypothetical protein